MKRLLSMGAAVAALCCGAAVAGPGVWTSEGPYGGAVYRLYVNPATPSVLYAGTRGGIFRSNDGGVSWARKEAGLTGSVSYTYALGMDAEAPGTLWVADSFGRFNRSTDSGDNWAQTGYILASGDAVNHIADAPGSTGKLYLATATHGVLVSSDSGASFLPTGSGLPSGVPINYVAVDPSNPLRLIAGVGYWDPVDVLHPESVYRSTDGGATWNGTLNLGYYGQVTDISFGAGSTVYAAIDSSLYRSDDDGASWNGPLAGATWVQSVTADPASAMTALVGGYRGLVRTTDGGASSAPLNTGLAMTAGIPVSVSRIALHPSYPSTTQLWLGTTDSGLFFSADSGATWAAQNDGLAAVNVRALAMFHDASTHRMFAGYGDAFRPSPALYRGNTTGPGQPFTSWSPSNTGLAAYQIRSVTIDPTTKAAGIGSTRLYATGRSGQLSGGVDARNGGLYRSLDGGNTWTTIDSGLPTSGSPAAAFVGTVRSLVLDPRSCSAPPPAGPCTTGPLQTVYATSNGRNVSGTFKFRIMKSTNGGDSWVSSDVGIPQPFIGTPPDYLDAQGVLVVPIVINPVNPQELFVGVSSSYNATAVPVPTVATGVFRSTDGGATWTQRSTGLPRHTGSADTVLDVLSLAMNPANPLELWCSVIDLSGTAAVSGGIYHTLDGGANWSDASTGLTSVDIRAIYVDPANPTVVYAAGGGTAGNPGGVYKSTNSGVSWTSISVGLPADAALALQVDPVDSSVIYAGTNSGVWSLTQAPDADADGVPDAVENAAPNGGDGNSDGIPDALEAKVGSLASASAASPLPGANAPEAANPYFTVAVTPVSGTCAQSVDVQSVYAAYHGNDVSTYGDNYSYPRQLARFEILDCQKATVTLKFHGASFASGYALRFFGPATPGDPATVGWYDFSSRATRIAPDTWQLTLDNGQFGSYRPASANAILFEGGPATHEGIFRNGFN